MFSTTKNILPFRISCQGEFSEHIRPPVFGWFGWHGDDPELATRMVDNSHGAALSSPDGPAAAQEVDLVIGIEASRQVKVQKAGIWAWSHGVAVLCDGLVPGIVWGKPCGAANSVVLLLDLVVQELLSKAVAVDSLEGKQIEHSVLKGAEPTLDFALGLRTRSDEV